MKDPRDPRALGERLEALAVSTGMPMTQCADYGDLSSVPDYVDVGPLERYGDPVAQHEAKIKAGLAARLP